MKKPSLFLFLGLVAAVCVMGCGSASTQSGSTTRAMGGQSCPMQVADTSVVAADVVGGATLTFATPGDAVELRRRVGAMAQMHNHHAGSGGMMGDSPMMPSTTATVDEVPGGARLVLMPVDPSQAALVQTHVHTCAERMSQGECPMMSAGDDAPER